MKLPSLFESKATDTGSQIGWAPAHAFFTKTIPLPEGVADDEVAPFIELELEELSPFPVEQLVWGYFADMTQRVAFAFAAVKPRVPPQVLEHWEDWEHVYPSFIHLVDTRVTVPTIKGLWHESVVTLVYYDGNSPFPAAFEHELIGAVEEMVEEAEDAAQQDLTSPVDTESTGATSHTDVEQALAAYERLQASVGVEGKRVEEGLLRITGHAVSDHDAVTVNLARTTSCNAEPQALDPIVITQKNGLWSAELRSSDFIEQRLKAIDFEKKLWQGYKVTGWVAVLALLMLVGNLVFDLLVKGRNDRYVAQQPASAAISEQMGYLESLQRFSGEQFRPRQIFEELNQERPKEIYFKNLEARVAENLVLIQGMAENVKQVNDYVDRLLNTGHFEKDYLNNTVTSKGDVKFNMKLFYKPTPSEETPEADVMMPTGEDVAVVEQEEI